MLSDGTNAFTWNARNQVATLNNVSSLQYDAFGQRTQNPLGTSFLYDGANAAQELSGTTATANLLSGGIDEFFSRTDASGSFTPLRDALGSTIALVDGSGVIATSYSYDPFGGTSVSGTISANEFQHTGRENEGNGLYYYRARYYNIQFGRFVSEDPVGLRGGINRVAYALDNPISNADPSGLTTTQIGGSLSGTLWGGTGIISAGIVVDGSGNFGIYWSWGGGAGIGVGVSGTADAYYSNASNINDLAGPFVNLTVGAGDGVDAAAGTFAGDSPDGSVVGGRRKLWGGSGSVGFSNRY